MCGCNNIHTLTADRTGFKLIPFAIQSVLNKYYVGLNTISSNTRIMLYAISEIIFYICKFL